MPNTYSTALNDATDKKVLSFISKVEQASKQNSGKLFDQFVQGSDVINIELYDANGAQIPPPTGEPSSNAQRVAIASGGEDVPSLSNRYYFSFAGNTDRYMLTVHTAATQVSDLRLEWKLEGERSDELGILEKSLNSLSHNLSSTLSELKITNGKLEKDIEFEKELERARLDFFSAASHELKTPITVIKGQLEGMLLGVGAYKNHEKYLTRSLEVANTLESMVQEILTISRLETANATIKTERFDAALLVREYLYATEDLITQKDLQLELDLPPNIYCVGSKILMEKVFSNLIGNAIIYSPQEATVRVTATAQGERWEFAVENTGAQIPENAIPQLFDAFYRVDQSRSRKMGGSGLGLYIVQKVLGQHGSSCIVCNTPSGVRFSFAI